MHFVLRFTDQAVNDLETLEKDQGLQKRLKAVRKTLGLLETNLKHPSLNCHKFHSLNGPNGEDIFKAYAESKTPAAYRVFWHYGSGKNTIAIIAITKHP